MHAPLKPHPTCASRLQTLIRMKTASVYSPLWRIKFAEVKFRNATVCYKGTRQRLEDEAQIYLTKTFVRPQVDVFVSTYTKITCFSLSLDIDECKTLTHKCDGNATCNNTLGSHTCTCKAGFVGNGTRCSGESLDKEP